MFAQFNKALVRPCASEDLGFSPRIIASAGARDNAPAVSPLQTGRLMSAALRRRNQTNHRIEDDGWGWAFIWAINTGFLPLIILSLLDLRILPAAGCLMTGLPTPTHPPRPDLLLRTVWTSQPHKG